MYYKAESQSTTIEQLIELGILTEVPAFEVTTIEPSAHTTPPVVENPKRRVRIKFPYDLRTPQDVKALDCIKGESWTAFVNQKQTLVHLMRFGHPEILIRLPKLNMKSYSKTKMKWLLEAILLEAL